MHGAISINTLSLPPAPLAEQAALVARLGARAISPGITDIAALGSTAAARLLRDTGLAVATLTHRAFGFATAEQAAIERARLDETIAAAAAIGAGSITLTTGGRGALGWAEAARRFADAIAPSAERARAAGVALAVEPTSHLYADASIAHRLTDTVTLARAAGIAVGIDIFACWFDADIEDAIAAAAPIAAQAQISDYAAADRALPCRAVPGDGMIPLDRLLGAMVRGGFGGPFDLEIIGPRLAAEGHEPGLRRAGAVIGAMLERAGLNSPPTRAL